MSTLTLQELRSIFLETLEQQYLKEEILSFFFIICENRLGFTRADIVLNQTQKLQKTDLSFFLKALKELQHEKPIQYIIGETEFYGLLFKVDNNVLIPRPETEELVEWIVKELRVRSSDLGVQNSALSTQHSALNILDIGTGSGCIAIALAKNLPNAEVFALDISKQALQLAQQNAKLNNVKVHFIERDILTNVIQSPNTGLNPPVTMVRKLKFDIIVSNPPYVRELEKHKIQNNVLENEPHLALFVDDENPLLFYDKIADFSKENLTKNGQLYFEINQYLGKEMVKLLKQKGFTNIELKKDILGNDRMVKAFF